MSDCAENNKKSKKRRFKPVPYVFPKADMHVHISLALLVEAYTRAVEKEYVGLGYDFLSKNKGQRRYLSLADHHKAYEAIVSRMKEKLSPSKRISLLTQTVQRYLERIAKEGAIYAEVSNSFRPGDEEGFKLQMEAIAAGIDAARYNTGIETRIVVTAVRNHGAENAENAARFLARYPQKYVTGFGLVGSEDSVDFGKFERAFNIAWKEAGLGLAPHVGEQFPDNAVKFLDIVSKGKFEAYELGEQRLRAGHATTIYMSGDLVKMFADARICMETCLSSNNRIWLPDEVRDYQQGQVIGSAGGRDIVVDKPLRDYFSDMAAHPLAMFLEQGVLICLGSDNPLLHNTNIAKEYSQALRAGVMEELALLQFTYNAVAFANVDCETRERLFGLVEEFRSIRVAGEMPAKTALGYVDAAKNMRLGLG